MTYSAKDRFPPELHDRLKYYVYRLIDPRNGETFYVGKGKGDRVYDHAAGDPPLAEEGAVETVMSAKLTRIRQIQLKGMAVQHVIHRHGMDAKTAFEVEGALIDAYPGLTNSAGGHCNSERGAMHADEIRKEFTAEPVTIDKNSPRIIEITINRSAAKSDIYRATRFAWRVSESRAEQADYVFAVIGGLIHEIFVPSAWGKATRANFPELLESEEEPGRVGFRGDVAPEAVREKYINKRMPPRARGTATPVRYFNM